MIRKAAAFILILVLPAVLNAQELNFRSNELGMPLEKLKPFQIDDFEYVLKVIDDGDIVVKVLLRDNKEHKRWRAVRDGNREQEFYYEEERLISVTRYESRGRISAIEYYADENLSEVHVYSYREEILDAIIVNDQEGTEIYRNVYLRDSRGRLRRVERVYPEKQTRVSAYTFGRTNIAQEWHGKGEEGDLFRYNRRQEPLSKEIWADSSVTAQEEFFYEDDSLEKSLHYDYATKMRTTAWYDEESRPVRILKEKEGALISIVTYHYNEEGKVVTEVKRTPQLKESWEYEYDGEGDIVREEYYRKGVLVSSIEHAGDDEYFKTYYREMTPIIREHYVEEEKVGEKNLVGKFSENNGGRSNP